MQGISREKSFEQPNYQLDKTVKIEANTVERENKNTIIGSSGWSSKTEIGLKSTDEKKVKEALDEINQKLVNASTRCEYTIHERSNRISIKIVDKNTEEVIREVPPEKTIKMIEKVWEIAGLIVDEEM